MGGSACDSDSFLSDCVLTDNQAKMEASRCLLCDNPPCVEACPASVPVKHFIRAIRFDTPRRAINLIREQNVLAGVCGLACPVDDLCVGACRSTDLSTPIAIGKLQHYAAVKELASGRTPTLVEPDGKKVAVIGAGPSGLAAAAELARLGHRPTILEKDKRAGGICTYGVPSERVPQSLVAAEVEYVRSLGVEIQTSVVLGDGNNLDVLFASGFEAVYVAVGAQQAVGLPIDGADLAGVTTWKAFLDPFSRYSLGEGPRPEVPKAVIIIGGGSVAMDVAGAAVRLGAEDIDLLCLESQREMPADRKELQDIVEAGVRFHTRSMPLEITGQDGKATGIKAVRIGWKEPDRFVPDNAEVIEGTEYWLGASMVVVAIGAKADAGLADWIGGAEFGPGGRIVVDAETGATKRDGVFAGGDAVVGGGMTIVKAVAEGKRSAAAIDAYLRG